MFIIIVHENKHAKYLNNWYKVINKCLTIFCDVIVIIRVFKSNISRFKDHSIIDIIEANK